MRRVSRTIVALALALAGAFAPAPIAHAKPRATVTWTRVEAPEGKQGDRLAKTLRGLLKQASRKTDFGKSGKVSLRARITEFRVETRADVMRIHCTVVGRLEGGPSAKSRISYGGDPKDPRGLEKQVLTMVAQGVTSRLAAIVRARESAAQKKKEASRKKDDG